MHNSESPDTVQPSPPFGLALKKIELENLDDSDIFDEELEYDKSPVSTSPTLKRG